MTKVKCLTILSLINVAVGGQAAMFTPGNVVVYRVGDGTAYTSDVAGPVFVDEYTTAGTLVQSIPMPTTTSGNQRALTARFAAGEITEGLLTRSANGRFLLLPGYSSAVNAPSPHGQDNSDERVVGRIDAAGNIDTSTGLGAIYAGADITGAASTDGVSIWASGGSNSGENTGINYTTFGSGTWTNVAGENLGGTGRHSTHGIGIWGDQMFATTNKDNAPLPLVTDVYQVGTGKPTIGQASVTTMASVPRAGGNPMAMAVFDLNAAIPGLDVLYYTDYGGSALSKFSKLLDGTWNSNGQVGSGGQDWAGLTATVEGNGIGLFATRETSGIDELVSVFDSSGHNGSLVGAPVNVLAVAGSNTFFRGVAFAPAPEPSSLGLLSMFAGALAGVRRLQ